MPQTLGYVPYSGNHIPALVRGSNPGQGRNMVPRFLLQLRPLANPVMMSTLITHCQWEDETVRERTGANRPPMQRLRI